MHVRVPGSDFLVLREIFELGEYAAAARWAPWLLYVIAFARGQETLSAVIPVVSLFLVALAFRAAPVDRPAA